MKNLFSWVGLGCFYILAFKVNPLVAGVMLMAHLGYEWLDHQEHKKLVTQLEYFKELNNVSMDKELMENYLEPLASLSLKKKDSGNC